MSAPLLEVCVDSYASCREAAPYADRYELCANLVIGGTTPSLPLAEQILRDFSVPVNVLIRPRFGDFLYDSQETAEMEAQVRAFRELGVNGVVIGALTPEGELDEEILKRLLDAAGDMPVTLHRAFDMAKEQSRALEQAVKLGFSTILTSGGMASALLGAENLKRLNDQAAGRIRLMAGAGVNAGNIRQIHDLTGITAFHGSCRAGAVESGMRFRKSGVSMGLPGLSEYETFRTSAAEAKKCAQAVHGLG